MDSIGTPFAVLLRQFRERCDLSCNELARAIGVDPSYISRLERGEREPPRRRVVEHLSGALHLGRDETDRLLVAGGYAPTSIMELGNWDPTINGVAEILLDQRLSDAETMAFRLTVNALVEHWRFRLNGA